MTDNDILKIEEALNISLPDDYKRIVKDNPFAKFKSPYNRNNLLDDPDEIIKINLKLREKGYQKKAWRDHFYVFGFFRHYPPKDKYQTLHLMDLKALPVIHRLDSSRRSEYKDSDQLCSGCFPDLKAFVEIYLHFATFHPEFEE